MVEVNHTSIIEKRVSSYIIEPIDQLFKYMIQYNIFSGKNSKNKKL